MYKNEKKYGTLLRELCSAFRVRSTVAIYYTGICILMIENLVNFITSI